MFRQKLWCCKVQHVAIPLKTNCGPNRLGEWSLLVLYTIYESFINIRAEEQTQIFGGTWTPLGRLIRKDVPSVTLQTSIFLPSSPIVDAYSKEEGLFLSKHHSFCIIVPHKVPEIRKKRSKIAIKSAKTTISEIAYILFCFNPQLTFFINNIYFPESRFRR